MGKRKKVFIAGGIVLLIALIAGCGVIAGHGPCGGFHRGFHRGFHHKDVSEFVLRRMDKAVEELNLSEAQRGKYEEMKGKLKTRFKELGDDRKGFMAELKTTINKEEPDVKALSESLKKRIERFSGLMEGNLDIFVEFYDTLDKEQKNKILAAVREKMKRWPVE